MPTLGAMIAAMGSPAEWGAVATSKLFWDDTNGQLGVGPAVGTGTGSTLSHILNIVGTHNAATGIHIWANQNYLSGRTQDADLYIWASEPYVTFSGCGIGNNIRTDSTTPYFNRIDTGRGGSYIRLLESSMLLTVVNSSGTHYQGIAIKTTAINMRVPGSYSGNAAAKTAGLVAGDIYYMLSGSDGWLCVVL